MIFRKLYILGALILVPSLLLSCGSKAAGASGTDASQAADNVSVVGSDTLSSPSSSLSFNADSAYAFVERQVAFGPRVPNSEAHARCADWLAAELRRHGAVVTEQRADLRAFDGTILHARNIFGQFRPSASDRILLLAHYDSRPWADADPDPANHSKPVDGANDGASGVGVLLEIARILGSASDHTSLSSKGVDILFVDAEDYGREGDDESWALGARYFAEHPILPGYRPSQAILLDMVGGTDASFPREYFSQREAPELNDAFFAAAHRAGHGSRFPNRIGGAITDDHLELLKVGIPAIDIIEYDPGHGFNPRWHTLADTMEGISPSTLSAVGTSLLTYLNN